VSDDTFMKDPPPALIRKWEAEALAAEALAGKHAADAAEAHANARASKAHAIEAEHSAEVAGIIRAREEYKRTAELTNDEYHYTYNFGGAVDSASAKNCISKLTQWVRQNRDVDPKPTIDLIFFSPGGSVTDGLALYDYIRAVQSKGHKVITGTRGMAASMAGILLQAGDERWMARESWLLVHQVQFGASGSWGDVEDRVKWVEAQQNRILDIFVERAARARDAGTATKTLTKSWLKKKWERTDWWVSATEALDLGFIDSIKE